jgi:predicted RNA-binding protein with PUA-like domain
MKYWLFPCNPKVYDLHGAFDSIELVEWHQNVKDIQIGDKVLVYVGKPSSSVEMLCEVVEANIPSKHLTYEDSEFVFDEKLANKIRVRNSVKLRKIKLLNIQLEDLKSHGLNGNVQNQRKIENQLLDYILKQL